MEDLEKGFNGKNAGDEGFPAKRDAAPSSRSSEGGSSSPSGTANGSLVFHYSREHRLSRASPSVRRVYEEGYNLNKGFIKGLTGNAGLKSTFVVIIILCAAIGLISFFGPSSDEGSFYGAEAQLKAFSFGESIFVSLSIDKNEGELPEPLPAMVAAELSLLDSEGNLLTEAIVTAWYSGEETVLRSSFPDYEGETVTASLYAIAGGEPSLEGEGGTLEKEPLFLSAKIIRE